MKIGWPNAIVRTFHVLAVFSGLEIKIAELLNPATQEECCSGDGDSESRVSEVNVRTLLYVIKAKNRRE